MECSHQPLPWPNNVDNHATSKAKDMLRSLTYNGEMHHWTFELYVNKQIQQCTSILENLVQHGYAGIDAQSKVHHLCNNDIKVPHLGMVKMCILSNETLCVDFAKYILLFSDFIKQKQATEGPPTWMIAQVAEQEAWQWWFVCPGQGLPLFQEGVSYSGDG